MGISTSGKSMNGVAKDSKKITGMAYNGDIIYYNPSVKIVSFADGTDEEIAAMLEAHYEGLINIEDYWSVGDTRLIHINKINSNTYNSTSHVGQDMMFVILDFNHDDLQTNLGIRTKAAITVQCRETLGNNGTEEDEYYWGKSYAPVEDNDNYTKNPLRTWLNGAFVNAMPTTFNTMIKTVTKKNLSKHSSSGFSTVKSNDKAFLLSYPEVFNPDEYFRYYLNSSVVEGYEGTQYEYYKIKANRVKNPNNNGNRGSNLGYWWLRSPSSAYSSFNGYTWCYVKADGEASEVSGRLTAGLAPAFCL